MGGLSNSSLVAIAIIVLSACSNAPKLEASGDTQGSPQRASTANVQPAGTGVVKETESQRLGRLVRSVAGRSVYFAYDDFTIARDYHDVVEAHAEVLRKSDKGIVAVVLEGNADERGSREYNLALGQKRAEATANALRTLGVSAVRIEAISFGREKPRAACHEEKCWAENRRVDFVYGLR